MKEKDLMQDIMLSGSASGYRLFRNNVAKTWIGKSRRIATRQTVTLEPGDVVISQARRLHAGLCEGSSDVIGWKPTIITPEMVGGSVAVFTAAEVKLKGRATDKQLKFVNAVKKDGGIGVIARSPEDLP